MLFRVVYKLQPRKFITILSLMSLEISFHALIHFPEKTAVPFLNNVEQKWGRAHQSHSSWLWFHFQIRCNWVAFILLTINTQLFIYIFYTLNTALFSINCIRVCIFPTLFFCFFYDLPSCCRVQCWGWLKETPSTTTAGTPRWTRWSRTRVCEFSRTKQRISVEAVENHFEPN